MSCTGGTECYVNRITVSVGQHSSCSRVNASCSNLLKNIMAGLKTSPVHVWPQGMRVLIASIYFSLVVLKQAYLTFLNFQGVIIVHTCTCD
jgi:hypothetical protein